VTEAGRRATTWFREVFATPPQWLVRSPGRVNLIGEHTDYSGGLVMPMAIDREVVVALRPRSDRRVTILAEGLPSTVDLDLDGLVHRPGWSKYVAGMAWSLAEAGHRLTGWEGVVTSDLPIGAGLSSSAAIELAVARSFSLCGGWQWNPTEIANLAQRAEQEWVGVACGIMDQLAVAGGVAGSALLIDCRSLELTPVRLPDEVAVAILDTGTRRRLTDSAYNQRRREVEAAAAGLGVAWLRDAALNDLERLPAGVLRQRARHVITENARVAAVAVALSRGDLSELGRLFAVSHSSLSSDFEVSSRELDRMVAIASATSGCIAARMTGAGFGGCGVALVESRRQAGFAESVVARYQTTTGIQPAVFIVQAVEGTSLSV